MKRMNLLKLDVIKETRVDVKYLEAKSQKFQMKFKFGTFFKKWFL